MLMSLSRSPKSVEKTVRCLLCAGLLLGGSVYATPSAEPGASLNYLDAQLLLKSGKWAEAAIALKSVLRERPSLEQAQVQLAQALLRLDRRSEAMSLLISRASSTAGPQRDRLIRHIDVFSRSFLSQESQQIYLEAVRTLQAGRPSDARSKLSQVLEKEKDNMEVLLRLGQSYSLEGDYDTAAERLKLASSLNPFEPETKLWLGRALTKRGEIAEGLKNLQEARADLPGSELALIWIAEAQAFQGQRPQAIEGLSDVVKGLAPHPLTLMTLARLRYEAFPSDLFQLENAEKELQRADLLVPNENWFNRSSDTELSTIVARGADVKRDVKTLLQTVQLRIERVKSERPVRFGS